MRRVTQTQTVTDWQAAMRDIASTRQQLDAVLSASAQLSTPLSGDRGFAELHAISVSSLATSLTDS